MAHSKQSAKRNRQNIKAREKNKVQRSAFKSAVKRVHSAESASAGKALLPLAMKRVDKAAKHGILHKNAAARLKSRMAKKLKKVGAN
ncbi:MAG: 30S ribosomal protein S20 [Planctomycetota bacterium]|nr:30S ribosomal protein S20 [Planctomycetota bacterium]